VVWCFFGAVLCRDGKLFYTNSSEHLYYIVYKLLFHVLLWRLNLDSEAFRKGVSFGRKVSQ
jgi:hypothetical protein